VNTVSYLKIKINESGGSMYC